MRRPIAAALAAAVLSLAAAEAPACEAHKHTAEAPQTLADGTTLSRALAVVEAWIPAPPPGAGAQAAYMTLHNLTDKARTITGVSSPQYAGAMLHESTVRDGIAMMAHVDKLPVAPGAMALFQPGGLHVMLMHPKAPVKPGDEVEIRLALEDGGTVVAKAQVRARSQGGTPTADNHAPHHHGPQAHKGS